jgi:lysophospholipase L1-like esterase
MSCCTRRFFLACSLAWLLLVCAAHAQSLSSQTIAFLPISDRPVTSAPFQVVAIASSNLPVTLTVAGPATIDDRRLLTLAAPGQVTITATQPGNTQYAAATAQLSFNVTQAASAITWQPPTVITYGTPLTAAMLNATATATPMVSPASDAAVLSSQLGTSQLAPGAAIPYPATSTLFRYEGSTMEPSPYPIDGGGYIPTGSMPPLGIDYRVAFTCDCQQFEFVIQSRSSAYRVWVDGGYTSLDAVTPSDNYPTANYVLVQFPDKRQRQVKVALGGAPPFFGVVTTGADTISAPQVPVGERVIVFGDSWTAPTILQALLPPLQDGISGSGYGEFLGEFFNWDYWVSGVGGEGYTNPGTDANGATFPARLLTDVCPFTPKAVILMGSTNDGGSTEATTQAAVTTSLNELQNCLNGAPVYLYGPQQPAPPVSQALAAATPAYNFTHFVDMAAQNWIYGNPLSSDVGNAYLYLAGHPTPLGHNFLAEKIAYDLVTTYPALLPQPYSLMLPTPAAGTFTYSAAAGALLPPGSTTLSATFDPSDTINYAQQTQQATIVVNKASSTTILSPQTQNGVATVGVTVQPQIGGTPTGSVVVSENGAALATLSLSNGAASYSSSFLAPGAHALSFTYGGDTNFTGSNASTPLVVPIAPFDFTVTGTPSTLTIANGGQVSVSLLITPDSGTAANLQLACTGLPNNATCAFANGSTLAVSGSPVITNVIIQTRTTTTASNHPQAPGGRHEGGGIAICGVLGAGLLSLGRKRRHSLWTSCLAASTLLAFAIVSATGCGGQSKPQTYTVQMQLTDTASATITHASTVTLTIL